MIEDDDDVWLCVGGVEDEVSGEEVKICSQRWR
jgi:hypothetical protein